MSVEERLQRLLNPPPLLSKQDRIPAIQYEAPSKLALITASRPVLSPSPSPSIPHSSASTTPLAAHIPPSQQNEQLPWPQCQGNCPRSPGGKACRDLNCALKSPVRIRTSTPSSPSSIIHPSSSPSPSTTTPSNSLLKPPPSNLTPFAALERAATSPGFSPEVTFDTTISGESTREKIDFRIHQVPSQQLTACSTPDVASQEAFCGYTDVEAELEAITHRAPPRYSPILPSSTTHRSPSQRLGKSRPDTPVPIPILNRASKVRNGDNMASNNRGKAHFANDPDIFVPLHYDTTYSQPEPSIDSALLSELVTDTTGFTQERQARRDRRAQMKEKERAENQRRERLEMEREKPASRGPPTHAVLYDEENRSCGRVPFVFSLVGGVALPEGGTGPALVAQPQSRQLGAPMYHSTPQAHHSMPPAHQSTSHGQTVGRSQSLRTQHMKAKTAHPSSRPSSRESEPTAESYATARGISPEDRGRLPPGASDFPPTNAGYDGRYPPLPQPHPRHPDHPGPQLQARTTSRSHHHPDTSAMYAVPAAPTKPSLDALIAAQIASPHPIPGIHHSVPARNNPWDDLFATSLYGLAYCSLAREEKKEVQRLKIIRGAQISASGSKGLAKIKAREIGTGVKSVGREMGRRVRGKREEEVHPLEYEFDAVGNMYARYADEPDSSYRVEERHAVPVPVKEERRETEQRPASRISERSGRSGQSARTVAPSALNGRRYLEGQV